MILSVCANVKAPTRGLIFLATIMAAGLPSPAAAKLGPANPEAIASAVADCWAAVRPGSVDQAVLRERGWQAGSATGDKRAEATPLQLFGKSGSGVLVMLVGSAEMPMCSVVSRVESAEAVSKAAQAVQATLVAADPQVKTARSGKSIVFVSLPRIATLDATGTKAEPAVRIVAGYSAEKK